MEPVTVPGNWLDWVLGIIGATLSFVVRGYAKDVKELRETHMPRVEVVKALADQQTTFTALLVNHQNSTDGNFRELRQRLDALNDTMLKVVLK